MAIEDIAGIGAEGSNAAIRRAHDDNQMIAVMVAMASEPYDFGHFLGSGNSIRASQELEPRDDGHTQTDQEDKQIAIFGEPEAYGLHSEFSPSFL